LLGLEIPEVVGAVPGIEISRFHEKLKKHFMVSIENSSFTIGRDSSGNVLPWSRSRSLSTFGFFIRTLTLD